VHHHQKFVKVQRPWDPAQVLPPERAHTIQACNHTTIVLRASTPLTLVTLKN
jgi:hypothetical protein